mgnify:FL=1|tara:strand:+ start:179 stop:544 length:366 start_codon:yes stop_codon:yes gene_type:complete
MRQKNPKPKLPIYIKKNRDEKYLEYHALATGVAEEIAESFGVEPDELFNKMRRRIPTMARHLSMWVLDKLGVPRTYICWFFNRDRTSIYACLKNAENGIHLDKTLKNYIRNVYESRIPTKK